MPLTASTTAASKNVFDDDDDDGWEDMPVVREDEFASGLDKEDQKKYHYMPSAKGAGAANATGNLLDVDDRGNEWRSKVDQNESEYTRLRVNEEDEADEVHLRTKYLFDEDKAMTPLSQMQATKNLLTEAQRIAYVGLCALTSREMSQSLKTVKRKELKAALDSMDLWAMKIMGRLYYHMELETQEQKMIESLAEHGVQALDLVPALMTTHTVSNPEYDPEEARRKANEAPSDIPDDHSDAESLSGQTIVAPLPPTTNDPTVLPTTATSKSFQTTAKVLGDTSSAIPGVSTSLSSTDEKVTLDIRWTVLCDLFLILIADSVYDARSRVLLENVAQKLGLGWLDLVKFESRVTEALEIQEDVEKMEQQELIEGGGLVIGLSAGLLAPVIGAGLGAAFTTIGITGTTGFLAGAGGAAVITTGGVLTGSGIAVRGMVNRTQQVRTFDILPLHNNKRVNCILTVPGFMSGIHDDVRLPFSVLDPIVGDVFSVLWEPEMIRETGSALKILTGEILSQIGLTVLQATAMTALMSALQWPIVLTKLGYLIDNPWNNALDRAKAAGRVLADVLMQRHLGVRPITLIGFSLGARVIFYALLEIAKHKAFGIVQDVFLLGATLTVPSRIWCEARSIVSGRFVNGFARNDWVLNYLFRATGGGVGTVAGLRPVLDVPGLENVDVTDKISGHMSYRAFMPLILDQLGFPVSADYFDEPVEPDFEGDRIVVKEEETEKKKGWFSSRKKKRPSAPPTPVSRPPTSSPFVMKSAKSGSEAADDDLPPRLSSDGKEKPMSPPPPETLSPDGDSRSQSQSELPIHAGFDLAAMKEILKEGLKSEDLVVPPQIQPPASPTVPSDRLSQPPAYSASPITLSSPNTPAPSKTLGPRSVSHSDMSAAFSRSAPDSPQQSSSGPLHQSPVQTPTMAFARTDSASWMDSAPTPQSSFGLDPFNPPELSFGTADGSVITPPAADPWAIPDFGKKKTGSYSENPWS
ncbi:hypothetical protein BD779DRAFT_1795853 [Infundibulicybe gibba]|nr:hypothetical protein BD779DRAFT_1795853 [Infundibulicybe gibba]